MSHAGLIRHPDQWWHFSLGDRMWAWLHNQQHSEDTVQARYGRI